MEGAGVAREAQRIDDEDEGAEWTPQDEVVHGEVWSVPAGGPVVRGRPGRVIVAGQGGQGGQGGRTDQTFAGPGDPAVTAKALALCVAEILTGAREVDSIARWITEDVHRHLQQRASNAARARSVARRRGRRASIRVGTAVVSRPVDGVAEVSVVVHTRSHARAVAIRLEVRAGRWRATAVGML